MDGKDEYGRFIIPISPEGKSKGIKIYYGEDGKTIIRNEKSDKIIKSSKNNKFSKLKLNAMTAINNITRHARRNRERNAITNHLNFMQTSNDLNNMAMQNHMNAITIHNSMFSKKSINEDDFFKELEAEYKKDKTRIKDKVDAAKYTIDGLYLNTKGILLAPNKIKKITKLAKFEYDPKTGKYYQISEPEYSEKDYKLREKLKNLKEEVKSIPHKYSSNLKSIKYNRIDKKLSEKYNIE